MKEKTTISPFKLILILLITIIISAVAGAVMWGIKFVHGMDGAWSSATPFAKATVELATLDPGFWNETPGIDETPGGDITSPTPTETLPPSVDDTAKYKNFVVMAYDRDTYREDVLDFGVFRTDTMILLTVYEDEKRITMTSIPRDLYVPIGGDFTVKDKINSVPYYASINKQDPYEAICMTVSRLFGGIDIDGYFAIDMDVFVEVVDIFGGIEYDVDVEVAYNGVVLVEKGKQVLDGTKALQYVQFRRTQYGDLDRVARQRKFLTAAFNQLKSLNQIMKLPEIYTAVMSKIDTNLTYEQIASLALFAATDLETSQIYGQTVATSGELRINGVSYMAVYQKERVHMIYRMFGISIKPDEQD